VSSGAGPGPSATGYAVIGATLGASGWPAPRGQVNRADRYVH
jgi:hypothetical protein